MIKKIKAEKNMYGESINGFFQYYGKDSLQVEGMKKKMEKYLFKECKTRAGEGIIIGLEDNNQLLDYYYIVYVPEIEDTVFELCNSAEFVKTIRV